MERAVSADARKHRVVVEVHVSGESERVQVLLCIGELKWDACLVQPMADLGGEVKKFTGVGVADDEHWLAVASLVLERDLSPLDQTELLQECIALIFTACVVVEGVSGAFSSFVLFFLDQLILAADEALVVTWGVDLLTWDDCRHITYVAEIL